MKKNVNNYGLAFSIMPLDAKMTMADFVNLVVYS